MIRDVILCDIDGTVANADHRIHLLYEKPKRWNEFVAKANEDVPYRDIVTLLCSLSFDYRIIMLTGRNDSQYDMTMDWLVMNSVPFTSLEMPRKEGDYREDFVVKKEWFDASPDRSSVLLVLEDRDQCVKMWREAGLTCLQVKDGAY